MKISIFGASGMVGKELVKQALNKGHEVTAFGRNVYSAFTEKENLHLVQGALFDENQVYDALKDSDAVLSALGGSLDGTDKTRSLGMKYITSAMKRAGVQRIIAVGGKGSLNVPDDEDIIMNSPHFPKQFLAVGKEHYKAFEYLKDSALMWTFIGAPDLIAAGPTGSFRTEANYPPVPDNNKINVGDLALFMLDELQKNKYVNQRVGISN